MKVRYVFYSDPVDGHTTLVVGWVIERSDHLLVITEMVGDEATMENCETSEARIIPKSFLIGVERIEEKPDLHIVRGDTQ